MCNDLESQWNWLLLYLVISRGRFQWQTMKHWIWLILYESYFISHTKSYFWIETLWKPDYYYNYRLVAGFIPIIVVFISYYTVQKALTLKQGSKVTRTAGWYGDFDFLRQWKMCRKIYFISEDVKVKNWADRWATTILHSDWLMHSCILIGSGVPSNIGILFMLASSSNTIVPSISEKRMVWHNSFSGSYTTICEESFTGSRPEVDRE